MKEDFKFLSENKFSTLLSKTWSTDKTEKKFIEIWLHNQKLASIETVEYQGLNSQTSKIPGR